MSSLGASWVMVVMLLALGCTGCAGRLTYRPPRPVRAAAVGVTAEIRDALLDKRKGVITLWIAAPAGGQLADATLGALPAPPCAAAFAGAAGTDWAGLSAVVIDQQESYHAGPADLSGMGHEVALVFVAPSKLWRRDHLAVDLTLRSAAPTPGCLRLELTGIDGADWVGQL